jgi:glycosyltransferase involved in cell wall biosynthesis
VLNGPKEANMVGARNSYDGPDSDAFTLFSHGTIEDRYGHDVLLEAVAIARERVPGLRLRITGTGTGVPELLRMVDELGLESEVEFLGWVSVEKLAAGISSADVGVISMKDSPYSNLVHTNKMFDYVLFDVPVIASRLRSVANYYDDTCIRYFEPDNASSLADAITDLYDDPDKRQTMVKNASALYERSYRWTVQQDILIDVTRELIE